MPQPAVLKSGLVAVTGASRGLGAAMTTSLLRRGFRVAAISRSGAEPADVPEDSALRQRLLVLACDVNNDDELARCFGELASKPGGLRAVINNAGVHTSGASAEFSSVDFEAMLRTNAMAVFSVCREAYPYLKKGGGVVINIGSVFESLGAAQNACYSASKAAAGALTRSLASEWARDDIAVINVAPGYVETDMNRQYLHREDVKAYFRRQTPLGRPARPSEIGELVGALLEANLMLLTGQTLRADGGHSIAHGHVR